MKKIIALLTILSFVFAGCEDYDYGESDRLLSFTEFNSTVEGKAATRLHLENGNQLAWDYYDGIGVYSDAQGIEPYYLSDENESAVFYGNKVTGSIFYAFSPYTENAIDKDNKKILHFRIYNSSSSDYVDNPIKTIMVAKSKDNNLSFKQTTGFIHISLTGTCDLVDYIYLNGNNAELLAGDGIVDISKDEPTLQIEQTDNASHTLYQWLSQDTVRLEENKPYDFYFSVPVGTYEKGISITIHALDPSTGETMTLEKRTTDPVIIKRAVIKHFTAVDTDEIIKEEKDLLIQEHSALLDLYNKTGGSNWKHNENWGTDLPLDEWYGVSTDWKGHVYSINLSDNNLTGSIPNSIEGLIELRRLYLSNNQLTGDIPESIGYLGNLEWIDLSNNQLTGGIPENIGNIGNLERLYLNNNQLAGDIPESIGYLGNLERLSLNNNQLTGDIPESIGNLANLQWLYLYNNQLTGGIPESIGNLANLGSLNLSNNQLTGGIPDSFMNLTKLESFWISSNRMDGTLSETLLKSEWWRKWGSSIDLRQQDGYRLKYGWLYESTDFSQDGKVTILQQHQKGAGIKIVITAEGFSDRMVNDGTFDAATKWAMEAFFNVEPYTTFRDYFDVYSVVAISKNEVIDEDVVFGTKNGNVGGSYHQTNHEIIAEYVKKVTDLNDILANVTTIVILNNDNANSRANCELYFDGFSIGLAEYGAEGTVQHETGGHGFGKLADEYTDDDETGSTVFTDTEAIQWDHELGYYLNVDTNNDKTKVLWKDFIANPDYEVENLGIYEGAFGNYSKGIYRSTQNSIMRYNTGGFNAPSRWAIYQRIMKLAGEDYSFESFLEYDKKNLEAIATKATTRNYVEKLPESKVQRGAPPVFHNYPSSEIGKH